MSSLPYGTRFYRGRISRTAKRYSGEYKGGSETNVNKDMMGISALISMLGGTFNKIPLYRRIFKPQGRG